MTTVVATTAPTHGLLMPNQEAIKEAFHSLVEASCRADPGSLPEKQLNVKYHVNVGFGATADHATNEAGERSDLSDPNTPRTFSVSVSPAREYDRPSQNSNFYAKHVRAVLEALQNEKNPGGEVDLGEASIKSGSGYPGGLGAIIRNVQPNVLLQTLRDLQERGKQAALNP